MSFRDFSAYLDTIDKRYPAQMMEARMRYLASGGNPKFLDPCDQPFELPDFIHTLRMEPYIRPTPVRVMPELDLPKPEYLHTIKLNEPTAVGPTTYKGAKP